MNPDQILALLAQQTGNAFTGAWNTANQIALPPLRGAANLLSYPLGYGAGLAMGVPQENMNSQYYNTISNAIISDKTPLVDAFNAVVPDVNAAVHGDPWAIAGLVPYAGRVARPIKAISTGVKAGQKGMKAVKAAKNAIKPLPKGVNPAKTIPGRVAQHVDRNAGKYYTGTIVGDLATEMYGGGR